MTWLALACFVDEEAEAERGAVGRCHTWQVTEVGLDIWAISTPACAWNDQSSVVEAWSKLVRPDKKEPGYSCPFV